MVSEKVVVKNPTGLHLRPAGALCKEAMNYTSSVKFRFNNTTANAKSVLSVLGACIKTGDELEFICEGPDEEELIRKWVKKKKTDPSDCTPAEKQKLYAFLMRKGFSSSGVRKVLQSGSEMQDEYS